MHPDGQSAPQRRESRRTASFHDMTARDIYARRFRAIGIPAVAAGVSLGRPATAAGRSTPSPLDIPAILRFGPETE